MKVTFLRHCRSIFNELKTSDKDCDLSDFGRGQAVGLLGNWDIIVCSVMKRTRKTLELSQIKADKIFYSELCREVKRDICDFLEGENENEKETDEQLVARVENFKRWMRFMFYKRKYYPWSREPRILVITHADFVYELNGRTKYLENAEKMEIDI
jgi:broad specificity phosphatase PhoE